MKTIEEKQDAFKSVIKTLQKNKVMVQVRNDGVYIRLAGNKDEGEAFDLRFANVLPFQEMTNTQSFAKRELDILAATVPDAILTPFANEILSLCEAFGKSGQSGGSAPFTATVISNALKHLLLQEPICDVTGHESEWMDITDINNGEPMWQNVRCSALFKDKDGKCSYVNSVVWKRDKNDMFSGWVYTNEKDFELISSSQFIKQFPFKPKTFYIDVVYVPIEKQEAEERKMHFIEDRDGKCHYSVVKNQKQLEKVWKHYDKKKVMKK